MSRGSDLAYSFEIASRFLRGGRGSILRTSSAVAFGGLALGVAALVVAMGLMTGYRADLADALVAVNAEILVFGDDNGTFRDADESLRMARATPGVAAAAPVVFQQGFAFSGASPRGSAAILKGIDPADGLPASLARRAPVIASLAAPVAGQLPPAIIGSVLAQRLRIRPGDPFRVLLPDFSGDTLRPRSNSFRLQATFTTGFAQYDSEWIFVPRDSARRALRLAGPTGIEVRLEPGANLDRILRHLSQSLPPRARVVDWRSINRPLFAALALQQRALFVALALIVGVAAFNLASSLRTLATGRTRDVGLLVATGARRAFVSRVFLWCGAAIGAAGTIAGLTAGVTICWILTATHAIRFPPDIAEIYFISWVPFRPDVADIASVGVTAVILAVLASVAPARRAASIDPAQALRYE